MEYIFNITLHRISYKPISFRLSYTPNCLIEVVCPYAFTEIDQSSKLNLNQIFPSTFVSLPRLENIVCSLIKPLLRKEKMDSSLSKSLTRSETQSYTSRVWTRVTDTIYNVDNDYDKQIAVYTCRWVDFPPEFYPRRNTCD